MPSFRYTLVSSEEERLVLLSKRSESEEKMDQDTVEKSVEGLLPEGTPETSARDADFGVNFSEKLLAIAKKMKCFPDCLAFNELAGFFDESYQKLPLAELHAWVNEAVDAEQLTARIMCTSNRFMQGMLSTEYNEPSLLVVYPSPDSGKGVAEYTEIIQFRHLAVASKFSA